MPIIKHNEDAVELQFGKGDIEVMPGWLDQDEKASAICFTRREPSPIGTHTDYVPYKRVEAEDAPVRMVFDNPDSIDVIIRALEYAKSLLVEDTQEGASSDGRSET